MLLPVALIAAEDPAEDDYARFRREVMGALEREDGVAIALLVHFPLHVNLPDDTTILIADELSLKRRFDQVFPPAFRTYVLESQKAGADGDGWTGSGYMLSHGALWAQNYVDDTGPPGLRIETVNASLGAEAKNQGPREVLFGCETPKHRIVIDGTSGAGAVRYRVWNRPRFPPDPPNLTLTGGDVETYGTGPCAHQRWTFAEGDTEIAVEENRCSAGSDAPPDAARAIVTVSIKGKDEPSLNCF